MVTKTLSRRRPAMKSPDNNIEVRVRSGSQPTIKNSSKDEFPCVCGQIFLDKKSHLLHVMSHRFNQDEYGARVFKSEPVQLSDVKVFQNKTEKRKFASTKPRVCETEIKQEGKRIKKENPLDISQSSSDVKNKLCENSDSKYLDRLKMQAGVGAQPLLESKIQKTNLHSKRKVKTEVEWDLADCCRVPTKRIKTEN